MQFLEAVLHLVLQAAEAVAKSMDFASRDGDSAEMGRWSLQYSTGKKGSRLGDDARQVDRLKKEKKKKQIRWIGCFVVTARSDSWVRLT